LKFHWKLFLRQCQSWRRVSWQELGDHRGDHLLSISLLPRVTSVEENFGLFILLLSHHPTRFSSVVVLLLQSQLPMWHTDALLLFSHDAILTHTISFVNEFLFNNRVLNTFIILILSLLIQINFFFILNFLIHLGDHLFVVLHLMFAPICLSLVSLISQIHL
jgi:hypothetical protein